MKTLKSLYMICLAISLVITTNYSTTYATPTSVDEREKALLQNHIIENNKKYKDGYNIDSAITDMAQVNRINELMKLIDPSGRENVFIVEEDGTVLSNKVSLLEDFRKQNSHLLNEAGNLKEPITSGIEESIYNNTDAYISGNSSTLASTGWKNAEAACPTAKTGPFRRVTTAEGYSRMHARIKLPTKGQGLNISTNANSLYGDKAYVYMGAIDKDKDHVDAGVAFNNEAGPYAWNEAWGMTMTGATKASSSPDFANFKSGWIVMKFYIPEKNKIVLEVAGIHPKTNAAYTVSILASIDGLFKDFHSNGSEVTLKRVTSIAQIEGKENLNSGSEFGNSTDYVWWETVRIGTTETNISSQSVGYFCGYKINNQLVDYTDQANEKIRIKTGVLNP